LIDGQTVAFILIDGNLDLLGTNVDFTRGPKLLNLQLKMSEALGSGVYLKLVDELENMLTAAMDEGAKPRELDYYLCRSVNKILSGRVPSCQILTDQPILAWDTIAACTLDSSKLVPGPTSTIDQFLSRIDFPEEFMAFVWKIFCTDEEGRQICWGMSRGHAGQTTFWNAVQSLIAPVAVTLQTARMTDKFSESSTYRKRFAIMSECTNRQFIGTTLAKKLTGGDYGAIEAKGQDSFNGKLFCRVVVLSNFYPEVDIQDNSLVSRLLLFTVKSFDASLAESGIPEKMQAEMYHFLYRCREVEKRICNGKLNIPVPEGMRDNIERRCQSLTSRAAIQYCKDELVFEPTASIKGQLLDRSLINRCGNAIVDMTHEQKTEVREAMSRFLTGKGCELGIDSLGVSTWRGVRLKTAKEKAANIDIDLLSGGKSDGV
jgi:hypothetical protein